MPSYLSVVNLRLFCSVFILGVIFVFIVVRRDRCPLGGVYSYGSMFIFVSKNRSGSDSEIHGVLLPPSPPRFESMGNFSCQFPLPMEDVGVGPWV